MSNKRVANVEGVMITTDALPLAPQQLLDLIGIGGKGKSELFRREEKFHLTPQRIGSEKGPRRYAVKEIIILAASYDGVSIQNDKTQTIIIGRTGNTAFIPRKT